MHRRITWTAALLLLTSCATKTEFKEQQSSSDYGYRIEDTAHTDTFYVFSNIKEGTKARYIISYVGRVVGETCRNRGFSYFDSSTVSTPPTSENVLSYKSVGFCYPTAQRKDLGVIYAPAVTVLQDGTALVVENAKGTKTKVRTGDTLKTVKGKRVQNLLELKVVLREAARKKEKSIEMVYLSKGKALKINEPLINSKSVLDVKSIENFKEFTD